MCAACNSYGSRKRGEGGGKRGEGENKSLAWSGRLALPELPGPWNWDLGCLPPPKTFAPFPPSSPLSAGGRGLSCALSPLAGLA